MAPKARIILLISACVFASLAESFATVSNGVSLSLQRVPNVSNASQPSSNQKKSQNSQQSLDALLKETQESEQLLKSDLDRQQTELRTQRKKSAQDFQRVALEVIQTPSAEGIPVISKAKFNASRKISKRLLKVQDRLVQQRLQGELSLSER